MSPHGKHACVQCTHTLKDRLPENILPLVAPSADWMEVQKFNDVETEKQTDFP